MDPTQPTDPAAAASAGAPTGGRGQSVVVPEDIRAKFPDLIELIIGSESMNDEERQYWVNILPIMTPEQVQNLRDILTNEKQQLAAIDQKYAKEVQQMGQEQFVAQVEEERHRRLEQRQSAEQNQKQAEEQATDDILKQIDQAG